MSFVDVSVNEIAQLKKTLQHLRNYINIEYKIHCSTFASPDPEEQARKPFVIITMMISSPYAKDATKFNRTRFTLRCQQCLSLNTTLNRIETLVKSNPNSYIR